MDTTEQPVIETEHAAIYPTKEQWWVGRRQGIGSSDAAQVLGVSKWGNPLTLYHEKKNPQPLSKGATEFQTWGLILEEPIGQRFMEETGRTVLSPSVLLDDDVVAAAAVGRHTTSRFTILRDAEEPRLLASPDRVQVDINEPRGQGILEIKNASIYVRDEWGEGEPPLEYQVQLQHQLMVTGLQWGSIAALIGGNYFVYADIPRDEEFIAQLRKAEEEFLWRLDNDSPPPVDGTDATKALLKRLYPKDTGEVIELTPDMLEWTGQLTEAKSKIKHWEAVKQEAENQIIAAVGDATMGLLPNGDVVTYKYRCVKEHTRAMSEFRVLQYVPKPQPKGPR